MALDAMGGDHAPAATVAGALRMLAADEGGVDVVLVGDQSRLAQLLIEAGADDALEIVHASTVVAMEEEPALALRNKPDASVRVAADLVAAGRADALVSAGSTGATLAAGLLSIGRQTGVRRPAVAAVLPTPGGGTILLDAGASPDVQPEAIAAYARMGAAYAAVRGIGSPRIGLLNVGAEPGKGNALAKAAHTALEEIDGFVGNVEPGAVLAGDVDVVVTDGFTGNVFLKTVEAAGAAAAEEAGGAAILLGCARPVLVAHGAASAEEIAAALRTARDVVLAGLTDRVADRLPSRAAGQETDHG